MEGQPPLGSRGGCKLWKDVDELVADFDWLLLVRVFVGTVTLAFGVWIFVRDCRARLRATRSWSPRMWGLAAIKDAEPGIGFYFGILAIILGILILPL
jgi:hypothetical protein